MIRFTKIRWDGVALTLELRDQATDTLQEERVVHASEPPHPDFDAALAACVAPALALCELPADYDRGLRVQSLSLSYDKDGYRGVTVTCRKILGAIATPLMLHTPHVSERGLDDGRPGACAMPTALRVAVDRVVAEAQRYLEDGKRAQGHLFADLVADVAPAAGRAPRADGPTRGERAEVAARLGGQYLVPLPSGSAAFAGSNGVAGRQLAPGEG